MEQQVLLVELEPSKEPLQPLVQEQAYVRLVLQALEPVELMVRVEQEHHLVLEGHRAGTGPCL